jgi:uncharacterized protein YkwD
MNRIVKRMMVFGVCLALVLAVAQSLGARTPTAGISYSYELERAIYQFTNEVRQKNGVPPLTWDNSLRDVARAHSADMLVKNYFSHNSPDGRTPTDRIRAGCRVPMSMTGENIWMSSHRPLADIKQLARVVVDNWMSSPGHRTNLLHPQFTDMGVGVATNGKEIKVTQAFIRHQQPR